MRSMMFLGVLALVGCVNPYVRNFHYAPGVTPAVIVAKRASAPPPTPKIIDSTNPVSDLVKQEADGFLPIGYSNFSLVPSAVPRNGAMKQGEAVGADRVLVFSRYLGTDFASGTMDSLLGSSLGRPVSGSPMSVARSKFLAVYLIKTKR